MTHLTPAEFNARLDVYLTGKVLPIIREHGWMIQGVFPTANDPCVGFSYTVGLTAAGLPELVISGLPHETGGAILNDAARRHLADEILPGATVDDIASVPFRAVDAPLAEVNMARNLYGDDRVRAVQLVWPDAGGFYPGEPGWSLGDGVQPIYREEAP
jgi:hypothetical protein